MPDESTISTRESGNLYQQLVLFYHLHFKENVGPIPCNYLFFSGKKKFLAFGQVVYISMNHKGPCSEELMMLLFQKR